MLVLDIAISLAVLLHADNTNLSMFDKEHKGSDEVVAEVWSILYTTLFLVLSVKIYIGYSKLIKYYWALTTANRRREHKI